MIEAVGYARLAVDRSDVPFGPGVTVPKLFPYQGIEFLACFVSVPR